MRRIALAAVFLVGAKMVAHAAEDCNEPNATQADLTECYGKAYGAADKELNGAYRLVVHRLEKNPDATKRIVAAQKAWIGFRDAECAFVVTDMDRGSALPMVESQCRADLTRKRTADLKRYLNCEEGDLSCPVPKPE